MEVSNNIPRSALDFKGYGELKAKASRNEKVAAKEVAKQFEAMFVQMMLRSMRAAVPKNEQTQSKTMETFEQMYDREIAVAMSRRGGLGLAEMIESHLEKINASSKTVLEGVKVLEDSKIKSFLTSILPEDASTKSQSKIAFSRLSKILQCSRNF